MAHTYGQSHGGHPHLKAYGETHGLAVAESLRVLLKPTVLTAGKLDREVYELEIGLLSEACAQEGFGFKEIETDGYSRQPVTMVGSLNGALKAVAGVTFQFSYEAFLQVHQVAAFDQVGNIVAYCAPSPSTYPRTVAGGVTIRAQDLTLRRFN